MQGRVADHGMADDVRFLKPQSVQNGERICNCHVLAVACGVFRDVGWWISALTERDASMRSREMAHLRLPGPVVAGIFVDEDDGAPGPHFFVIQLCATGGGDIRHSVPTNRGGV